MYYPSSENKGADQLRGYREADLRLCFRLGKNPVFSCTGSYCRTVQQYLFQKLSKVETSKDMLSHDVALCAEVVAQLGNPDPEAIKLSHAQLSGDLTLPCS